LKNETGWTWLNEVTIYNPHGFELENKNTLGQYSSALYGYGNIIPKAVVNNSLYREMGFDGFEDYDLSSCDKNHFSYAADKVKTSQAHTGRKSIIVAPHSSTSVSRPVTVCEGE
jgi:hypothetical protein